MRMKINSIIHYNKLGNGLKDVLLDIELSSDEKIKIHDHYTNESSELNDPDYDVEDVSVIVYVTVKEGEIREVDTYYYPSDFGEHRMNHLFSKEEVEECIRYVKENFIGKEQNYKQY